MPNVNLFLILHIILDDIFAVNIPKHLACMDAKLIEQMRRQTLKYVSRPNITAGMS